MTEIHWMLEGEHVRFQIAAEADRAEIFGAVIAPLSPRPAVKFNGGFVAPLHVLKQLTAAVELRAWQAKAGKVRR